MGDIRIIKVNNVPYGVEVIGGENSHWRYRTRDGAKHRSMRAAREHVVRKEHTNLLSRLARRWSARLEVAV